MQSLEQLLSDFKQARMDHERMMRDAPRIIGVECVKIIHENFKIGGYDSGNGVEKWQPRKPSTNAQYDRGRTKDPKTGKLSKYRTGKNSTFKGSVYSSSKPLEMQTLNMYNSITYKIAGGYIFIGGNLTLVPYLQAQNEGLNHQPVRQFMPRPNQGINVKMIKVVNSKLKIGTGNAMRKFKL